MDPLSSVGAVASFMQQVDLLRKAIDDVNLCSQKLRTVHAGSQLKRDVAQVEADVHQLIYELPKVYSATTGERSREQREDPVMKTREVQKKVDKILGAMDGRRNKRISSGLRIPSTVERLLKGTDSQASSQGLVAAADWLLSMNLFLQAFRLRDEQSLRILAEANARSPGTYPFPSLESPLPSDIQYNPYLNSVLNLLSDRSYSRWQNKYKHYRLPGTCDWFLDSDSCQKWKDRKDAVWLWCDGPAGIGKTFVASKVAEDACAYYYMGRGRIHHASDVMAGILQRLCERYKYFPEDLAHDANGTKRYTPLFGRPRFHYKKLEKWFRELVDAKKLAGSVGIVIDGFDEQRMRDVGNFVSMLSTFQNTECSVIVFSQEQPDHRFSPKIWSRTSMTAATNEQAIRRVLRSTIASSVSIKALSERHTTLREDIEEEVVKIADGRFFRCKCQMDQIMRQNTPNALLDLVATLRDEKKRKENDIIDWALGNLSNQPEDMAVLARRTLIWLAAVYEPLSITALCEALTVAHKSFPDGAVTNERSEQRATPSAAMALLFESEESKAAQPVAAPRNRQGDSPVANVHLQNADVFTPELVVGSCESFVWDDQLSSTIVIANFDIETRVPQHWKGTFDAESSIFAATCIRYLLLDDFAYGPRRTPSELHRRLSERPFLEYASRHWLHHYCRASAKHLYDDNVESLALKLLKSRNSLLSAAQVSILATSEWDEKGNGIENSCIPDDTSCLEIAKMFGLEAIVMQALNVDGKKLGERAPVTQDTQLSDALARSLCSSGSGSCDPLISSFGEEFLWELLLTDSAARSRHGMTLLEHAIKADNLTHVRIILKQYSHTGIVSTIRPEILTLAIMNVEKPNIETIRELLVAGIPTRGAGPSPLDAACKAKREDIVSLLIQYGVSPRTPPGSLIDPPLFTAVRNGSEDIVRTLLRNGASTAFDEYKRTTALHIAVQCKPPSKGIIRLLLASSTDIHAKDDSGKKAQDYTEDPYLLKLFKKFDFM